MDVSALLWTNFQTLLKCIMAQQSPKQDAVYTADLNDTKAVVDSKIKGILIIDEIKVLDSCCCYWVNLFWWHTDGDSLNGEGVDRSQSDRNGEQFCKWQIERTVFFQVREKVNSSSSDRYSGQFFSGERNSEQFFKWEKCYQRWLSDDGCLLLLHSPCTGLNSDGEALAALQIRIQ